MNLFSSSKHWLRAFVILEGSQVVIIYLSLFFFMYNQIRFIFQKLVWEVALSPRRREPSDHNLTSRPRTPTSRPNNGDRRRWDLWPHEHRQWWHLEACIQWKRRWKNRGRGIITVCIAASWKNIWIKMGNFTSGWHPYGRSAVKAISLALSDLKLQEECANHTDIWLYRWENRTLCSNNLTFDLNKQSINYHSRPFLPAADVWND